MRTTKETLKFEFDTWDDPGDYPSGAGGGPLPSYSFVAGVAGQLTVVLDASETRQIAGLELEGISNWINENPDDVEYNLSGLNKVRRWVATVVARREDGTAELTLEVDPDGFEAEVPEYEPPDDYDDER